MKKLLLLCSISACAFAQSQIYGNRVFNGGYFDASGATATRPLKTGTAASIPSTCNAGDLYFETDATAGKNLYACTSANTWVQASGGNAAGVNEQTASYTIAPSDSGKLVVMNCSVGCTLSMPTSPSNGFYTTVLTIGSSIPAISLSGKQFNGSTSIPFLISFLPWSFWSDGSNFFGKAPPLAGSNINFAASSSALTISATSSGGSGWTSGPLSGIPSTCTVGQAYFATDQPANQQLYTCSATNTWTKNLLLGASGAFQVTSGALDINPAVVPTLGNVNTFTAANAFNAGINLFPGSNVQPTCSSSTRGDIWFVNGGSSADGFQYCAYNGSTYAWASPSGGGFTGTAGSVPFVGAGGSLTQDNAAFFWNDTGKQLGIGANTGLGNDAIGIVKTGTSDFLELYEHDNNAAYTGVLGIENQSATHDIFAGLVGPSAAAPLTANHYQIYDYTGSKLLADINPATGAVNFPGAVTCGSGCASGGSATSLVDSNGNPAVLTSAATSAVNQVTVVNAATTAAPSILATGSDTNINLNLDPKGSGTVECNASVCPFNWFTGSSGLSWVSVGTNVDTLVITSAAGFAVDPDGLTISGLNETNWQWLTWGSGTSSNHGWLALADHPSSVTSYDIAVDHSTENLFLGGVTTTVGSGNAVSILASENNHIYTHGTAPTPSVCTLSFGNDHAGEAGMSAAGNCSLTWASPYASTNYVVQLTVTPSNALTGFSKTASALTITTSAAATIDYTITGVN